MKNLTEIMEEFGSKLVETEHNHFSNNSEDNCEYIPRIERFVKCIRDYLKENNINEMEIFELEIKIFKTAENLFVADWMRQAEEGTPDAKCSVEYEKTNAVKTFYSFVKEKKYRITTSPAGV